MDHDRTLDVELTQLLERASMSALTTLDARIDVARRLRDLRDDLEQETASRNGDAEKS